MDNQVGQQRLALVTGALGHTGSFLTRLLADHGWHVVATDLDPTERQAVITKDNIFDIPDERLSIEHENVEYMPADLTDKVSLYPLFECRTFDTVFHTASLYDYFAPLDLLDRVNVGGLRNLLDVYHETGQTSRFIHWSTCGVYGQPNAMYGKHWEHAADETASFNPPNDYSKSKVLQEMLLRRDCAEWGTPYVIIRPAPIYGPFQRYGTYHIFHLERTVGSVPVITLYPTWRKLRMPMVHVEDLVRAAEFIALAPAEKVVGEAFNVIDDCGLQKDFMEITAHLLHTDSPHLHVPWFVYSAVAKVALYIAIRRAGEARKKGKRPKYDAPMAEYITHQYWFSNQKIKNLGFTFKFPDMFSGTKQTIEWYVDHGWLKNEKTVSRTKNVRGIVWVMAPDNIKAAAPALPR
jgi:nucleoside-diphosphate-sugar epimerase